MSFILMALCKHGKAQYSIDTREQTVKPGDLLLSRNGILLITIWHHRISSACVSWCRQSSIMGLSRM